MKRLSALFVAALLLSAPAIARDQTSEVEAALGDWKEAVESGKVDDIVKLYDKKAVMISAFAQKPITTRAGLIAYYKKVVANPDVKVEFTDLHTRMIGPVAIESGTYTLSYTQDGEDVVVPSRFTFVYRQDSDKKWLIADHHSSRVPLPSEGTPSAGGSTGTPRPAALPPLKAQ